MTRAAGCLAPLAVLVLAACGSSARHAAIDVTPALSHEDQPLHVALSGLPPRSPVVLDLRSTDANRVHWHSTASFTSDGSGRLDLDHDPAKAGSYTGVWGSGLLVSMHPDNHSISGYFWGRQPVHFSLRAAVAGKPVAETQFTRRFGAESPPVRRHMTLARNGFFGDFWAPKKPKPGKRPAIVAIGGSEGGEGTSVLAALLASHGYPTLALAYFKEPGLPQTLSRIPLEYFARALRWLGQQPHVDPRRMLMLGISRGSEAAQLVGVHFPGLVHGVVAAVPSSVVNAAFPDPSRAAWTLGGKPLSFTRQFNEPAPTDNPAAIIPVEGIRGPMFLVCGELDAVWGSCPYAGAIVHRLDMHHDPYLHPLYRARLGGHLVGALLPYEPGFIYAPTEEIAAANERARERIWPHLLGFLTSIARAQAGISDS